MLTPLNVGDLVRFRGQNKVGRIVKFHRNNRALAFVQFDEEGQDIGQFNVTTLSKVDQPESED